MQEAASLFSCCRDTRLGDSPRAGLHARCCTSCAAASAGVLMSATLLSLQHIACTLIGALSVYRYSPRSSCNGSAW